jgi:hypothetical protein
MAMRFSATRRLGFRTVSQIGVHYRGSPLSQADGSMSRKSPQPGDRFPWLHLKFSADTPKEDLYEKLDDTCFHLLVFGQPIPPTANSALNGLVRVHEIPSNPENSRQLAHANIPERSCYLLRPDGHIGLAGVGVDDKRIERYLEECLRVRAAV